jgi:5-formyltetrahydrofolate cyclo-ligase
MISKSSLRRELLRKRAALEGFAVISKSNLIFKNLISLKEITSAHNFLVYLPVYNEVDTRLVIDYLKAQNSSVFVPAFSKIDNIYKVVKFSGFDNLEHGPYKIPQPKKLEVVDADTIDVALIPGVGFDSSGVRLGYGKAVYDKLLNNFRGLKIGLAYDFQIIDKIPEEKHDLKMNAVVSEKKIYDFT